MRFVSSSCALFLWSIIRSVSGVMVIELPDRIHPCCGWWLVLWWVGLIRGDIVISITYCVLCCGEEGRWVAPGGTNYLA